MKNSDFRFQDIFAHKGIQHAKTTWGILPSIFSSEIIRYLIVVPLIPTEIQCSYKLILTIEMYMQVEG